MKNAIAVGIGGLMLVVAWFFDASTVLEQLDRKPDAAITPTATADAPSDTAITPSDAPEVPPAAAGTTGLLGNGLIAAEVYSKICASCHVAGLAAAPRFGNKKEWARRIAKGLDTLYRSSIDGVPPAMPAKGMCFDCSDDDLKAVVDYMVSHSR